MVMPSVNLSTNCVKYLLFGLNFLFVVTGIVLISIGSTIAGYYSDYDHFLSDSFHSVPRLLITIGIIIFIIAFFGCYGSIKENYCMILTFAALMVLIFILELLAGIYGYALRGEAKDTIGQNMKNSMKYYGNINHTDISAIWDDLQYKFTCCGMDRPDNWVNQWTNETWKSKNYLPYSCCKIPVGAVGDYKCIFDPEENPRRYHIDGCLSKIAGFISSHALQLGGAGLGIAFCQALGIWFALFLAKAIKKSYLNM